MTATPLDLAIACARSGWPVFPCSPSDKRPLIAGGFHSASLDREQITAWWSQHPDAMIGVPTGTASGVFVLDIDVPPAHADGRPWLAEKESEHGALTTRQATTASGGMHFFFRHCDGVRTRGKGFAPGVEVRGEGGYVIVPGSRRADGATYVWANTEDFADAPDWLLNFVKKEPAAKPAGGGANNPAYVKVAVSAELDKLAGTASGRNNALNDAAFAIGQFVGAGAISRHEAERRLVAAAHTNGYVAKDGRAAAAATVRSGIEAGMASPRDVPAPLRDMDAEGAASAGRLRQKYEGANDNDPDAAGGEEDWEHEEETVFRSDATLADLTHPGGYLEELIDWIVSSAEHPSRELALSAVIPFVGALIGRRFSGYRNARSNVYVIALAPSGYGKDHARQQIKRLIAAEHLHKFQGPARLMSASGLRNALLEKPSISCMIDEVGGPLREMLDARAGEHKKMLKHDLLDYFSAASTYFEGAAFTQLKAVRLENPNLCLYGTTTPDDFWSSVSGLATMDGFLARLLLFNMETAKPAHCKPERDVDDIPRDIREKAKALALAGRTGNLQVIGLDSGELPFKATAVPLSDGADRHHAEFKDDIARRIERADPAGQTILNRAVEHAVKLALIASVATDPDRLQINERQMSWAIQLSWLSCCALMREAKFNVSDSMREANVNRILRLIRDAGESGLFQGQLRDRTRGIDHRQRTEIVEDLMAAKRIETRLHKPEGAGRPSMRYHLRQPKAA